MWINFKLFYALWHEVNTPPVARDQQQGSVSSLNERRSSSASCHISGGLWRGGCWETGGGVTAAGQPQWVSWRCQRETKVKTPEALAQTSRSSPSHRSRWNNRNKEYLQHTALIKAIGHTKTCVTVILPHLMGVC